MKKAILSGNKWISICCLCLFISNGCNKDGGNELQDEATGTEKAKGIFLLNIKDSMDWLLGDWHLMDSTTEILDAWVALDDTLKGYTFQRVDGQPVLIDLMSISNRNNVTCMNAMPVDQNNGRSISFKLVQYSAGMARFENPEHDFPQWFEFYRTNDSSLNVQYGSLTTYSRISKFYTME